MNFVSQLRMKLAVSLLAALLGSPVVAQQPDAPNRGDKTTSPSARVPRQEAPLPDNRSSEQGIATPSTDSYLRGHRPPDASWHAPIAAFASLLGITALLAHLGVVGPVASVVAGIVVIAVLQILVFSVWWRLIRYGAAGRRPL